jgi:hypothetical protein
METILAKYNIEHVWHFTDRSNLESIERHGGILSRAELNDRGIAIPNPGGNDWSYSEDKRLGLDKYVHLAFIQNHPMLYIARSEERISDPVVLKIDGKVLLSPGVRFCAGIANKSGAIILDREDACTSIDFEVLFRYIDWRVPENQQRRTNAEKSEILVPDFVPADMIVGF